MGDRADRRRRRATRAAGRASRRTTGWRRRSDRRRDGPAPCRSGPNGTPAGSGGAPARAPTVVRLRSVTSRSRTTRPACAAIGMRAMQRRLHEVRDAGGVDQFEHRRTRYRSWFADISVPTLNRCQRSVIVFRSSSPIIPRKARPTRSSTDRPVNTAAFSFADDDRAAGVEPHHRVGKIVEQLAHRCLGRRQLVDRGP